MALEKTRAGLVPVETEVSFHITTEKANEFLQDKVDKLVNIMNQKGTHQEDVNIRLLTLKCGKKFYPFMLLLPLSVLEGNKKKTNGSDLEIFNPQESEGTVNLKDAFYSLFGGYIFNKNDESSFFSATTRQNLGTTNEIARFVKANRRPRIQKINNNNNKFVTLLIDPIRVFHDMLTDVNNKNERFGIEVGQLKQIKTGNYRYQVFKIPAKKRNSDKSFDDRIDFEIAKFFKNKM